MDENPLRRGAARLSRSSLDAPRAIDRDGPVDRPFLPLDASAHERPLFDSFTAIAARAPDAIAIEDGASELSYADVLRQARNLAAIIADRVAPGEPVGLALPNGAACPVAMLAALAAGRPFVPLDLTFPAERNALIVERSGMRAVVVTDATRAGTLAMDETLRPIVYDEATTGNATSEPRASPDDIALITFTSGSEGRPKGVYLTQRSLVHKTTSRIDMSHIAADDRVLLVTAPAVAASQRHIFGALLSGARLVIVDLRRKGLQAAAQAMAERGVTLYASAPYVFRRLMEMVRDPASVASVRQVSISSDRIFASDVALFRERFAEPCLFSTNFGSNEASTNSAWFVPRSRPLDTPLMPVGYALPGFDIAIGDEDGATLPRGEIGEITVSGRYISEGYWRDPAATARVFSVDPGTPAHRTYRTGDLGRMAEDGLLELIGRKDRQLKIRGLRVEPAEVEAVLRAHPVIRDAAIIPRATKDNTDIVAYATARPDAAPPEESELAAWLAERLPHAMRPRRVYLEAELPLLGNFKPDIMKLRALDAERAEREAADADAAAVPAAARPDEPSIAAIRHAWERILGRASYAADLTWDEAGGDSLKALELVFALEAALGRPVAMGLVEPGTRPSDLARRLARVEGPARGPRLFFLPGWLGTILHEAPLLRALATAARVEVVDYPPLAPTRLGAQSFDAIVEHVVHAIRARLTSAEPIALLGYSFGGCVAFEAARRLSEAGIEVGFLGLIDVSAPLAGASPAEAAPSPAPRRRGWLTPFARVGTALSRPHYAYIRFIIVSIERQRWTHLAWLWHAVRLLRLGDEQTRFRELTCRLLRLQARDRFTQPRSDRQCCVIRADGNADWAAAAFPEDLGWGAFCNDVDVRHAPGDHLTMIANDKAEGVAGIVLAEVARAAERSVAAPLP